jgi:hypothetical protein
MRDWETDEEAIAMVLDAMLDEPLPSLVMARSGNIAPVLALHPHGLLAFTMCRAWYDRSLDQDESEALVEFGQLVLALATRMGFQISHELAQTEFMAPLLGDEGSRPMRI